jgi:eukaryotic-like serine/threonine-protein kinase
MPPVRPRYSPDAGKPAPVAADSTPPGPTQQEIAQARERMIQLDAKAEADRAGIQQIRGQQHAQGLDMRRGMLAALNRMNAYVSEANRALNQNDLQTANDDMDRAEKEMAT